jgi:creatinine amidohydrolase/Fe(II)-dependent formamide hydrolase-like protein
VATTNRPRRRALAAALLACCGIAQAALPGSLHLEDLTWPELRDRVAAGTTIALVPIGGTEQNGPHLALGKHNLRVRVLAERIARELGNAVVAPVLAYVPEGSITPPTEHMRWPGSISVPVTAFEATLEATAKSLQRAGLAHVFLLGDHGGYRASLERVAARAPRVHALPEYYRAARIGEHAGRDDTALTLAIDASLVRIDIARGRAPDTRGDGAVGDPRSADAQQGKVIADRVVAESVAAIRRATAHKFGRQSRP